MQSDTFNNYHEAAHHLYHNISGVQFLQRRLDGRYIFRKMKNIPRHTREKMRILHASYSLRSDFGKFFKSRGKDFVSPVDEREGR